MKITARALTILRTISFRLVKNLRKLIRNFRFLITPCCCALRLPDKNIALRLNGFRWMIWKSPNLRLAITMHCWQLSKGQWKKIYTQTAWRIGICQTQRRVFEQPKNRTIFEDNMACFFSCSKTRMMRKAKPILQVVCVYTQVTWKIGNLTRNRCCLST